MTTEEDAEIKAAQQAWREAVIGRDQAEETEREATRQQIHSRNELENAQEAEEAAWKQLEALRVKRLHR